MSELSYVEYRVKRVDRFIITRFAKTSSGSPEGPRAGGGSVAGRGEYDNADTAYEVAYALARAEHENLGWPAFDDRMQYPRHPNEPTVSSDQMAEVSAACAGIPVANPTL